MGVTRKSKSNRQQRRGELAQRLLEATEGLMSDGLSFTELSVDRLAAEAGISRATFYIYFEDKRQLLLELSRRVTAELGKAAALWFDASDKRDPESARRSVRQIVAVYREHQAVLAAFVELASYDPVVAEAHTAIVHGVAGQAEAALDRAIAAGAAGPAHSLATSRALTWMIERTCHQLVRNSPPEADDAIAEALTEIIWRTWYLEPLNR
ncbi:TetR/AcrR family transcriptional regulator [Mycobacterium sp. NPDC051804]|uniref:TetR/AcrR family transcriptional regulator n=1 Tax=Mycobacterium sp. NPDC051804 TaxID=3364295 RepID=UPI00379D199F